MFILKLIDKEVEYAVDRIYGGSLPFVGALNINAVE